MANYFGNRSAIILECPHCKEQGDHHTRITEQPLYSFSGAVEDAIVAKIGVNLGYRIRIKDCRHCGLEFRTAEIPAKALEAMAAAIEEAQLHFGKARHYERALKKLRNALRGLSASANETLTGVLPIEADSE